MGTTYAQNSGYQQDEEELSKFSLETVTDTLTHLHINTPSDVNAE